MSPDQTAADARGHELDTVLATRDLTVLTMAGLVVASTCLLTLLQLPKYPTGQLLVSAPALPLMGLALWRRGRGRGLLPALLALLLIVTSTAFATTTSNARITASVIMFVTASLGIVALPDRWRWPWIGLVAALWSVITPAVALPVTFGGTTVNARWFTLAQLLSTCVWMAVAWPRELARVVERDRLAEARRRAALAAVAYRERVRVWRRALTHVHETVLNDIRSVLDNAQVDWGRLAGQLAERTPAAPPLAQQQTLRDTLHGVGRTDDLAAAVTVGAVPDLGLDEERATALRNAVIELCRNLIRHSHARRITISSHASEQRIRVSLRHDGRQSMQQGAAGIGAGVVLEDALAALGANLQVEPTSSVLILPTRRTGDSTRLPTAPDTWRVVLSAGAAGNAVGGVLHYAVAALAYGRTGVVLAGCGVIAAAAAAVTAVRRRSVAPWAILVPATAAVIAPMAASTLVTTCSAVELPLSVSTLASIGAAAVAVWAPSMRWAWPILANAVAMLYLGATVTRQCSHTATPGLIAAFIGPTLLVIVLLALRRALQQQGAAEAGRAREVREQAAAAAVRDFGRDLHDAIDAATALLRDSATRGHLAPEDRRRLRNLDASIRASIQVDPETAGALAMLARACVHQAVGAGIPVRVLALRDSGDRRPFPSEVEAVAQALLLASTEGDASVQVLGSPAEDVLVLVTTPAAVQRSGVDPLWSLALPDGDASLDCDDEEEQAMLFVRRRAQVRNEPRTPANE